MNRVQDEYEVVDGQHWVLRFPGVAMSLVALSFSAVVVVFGTWIDDRQRPTLDKIGAAIGKLSQENRQLATFQLESQRYIGLALSNIAESANVAMPDRPKALDRAEGHVRNIQERVN